MKHREIAQMSKIVIRKLCECRFSSKKCKRKQKIFYFSRKIGIFPISEYTEDISKTEKIIISNWGF